MSCANSAEANEMMALAIHETDEFCKKQAQKSENGLRTLSRMARTPEIEKCKQFFLEASKRSFDMNADDFEVYEKQI